MTTSTTVGATTAPAAGRRVTPTGRLILAVNDYRNRQSADNTASYIRHGTNHSPHCKNPYQPAGAYETHTELIDDFTRLHARYTKQATP